MSSARNPPPWRGRRLRELLEEQQEQFLLYVENGHSDRSLRSLARSWWCPASGACRMLPRLSRRRGGILRRAFYKIVHWKIIRKVRHWVPENRRWKLFSCFSDIGSEALAMKFERLSCSGILSTEGASDRGIQRKDREENEQQSPVSVFELHSDDCSAFCSQSVEDNPSTSSQSSSELEELLACSYSPTPEDKREWHQAKNVMLEFLEELEGRIWDPSQIIRLVGMDFLSSRREWNNCQNEMQMEIGREIEGAIFEEMRDEVVEDMIDSH